MLKVVGASWVQTTVSFCILVSILIFGIFLILIVKYRKEDDGKYSATVHWNPYTEGFDIYLWGQNNDPQEVSRGTARAYYQPSMHATGWAVLEIETSAEYSDKIQAYAAGILEGTLTWQLIYWQWMNTIEQPCLTRVESCDGIRQFLRNNTSIIRKKAAERGKTDPFWHQVNLFYIQLDGVEFGWRYEMKKNKQEYEIPKIDFMWMNMIADFKDVELSTNNRTGINHSPVAMTLLKLLSNNSSDFLLAHASSGQYSSMLRIQKKYKFNYHWTSRSNTKLVPGRTISFTSYPASIHSQDDFYQITLQDHHPGVTKVTVTGTTVNLNFRRNLNVTDQVLLGPRIMAANRLSKDGRSWSGILKSERHILGNKQWMHIQTKANEMHFWVLEQTHLKTISRNETSMLKKQGFWIHCGIPHYQEIYNNAAHSNDSQPITQLQADPIAVETEKVLKTGQINITNLSSLINLLRGPDLSLVGRTDLHIALAPEPAALRTDQADSHNKSGKLSPQFIFYNKDNNSYKIQLNESQVHILHLKKLVSVVQSMKNEFDSLIVEKGHKSHKPPPSDPKNKTFSSVNGIIDLKVTKNNDHFLAAAGPPFNVDDKNRPVAPFQWSKSRINYLPHSGHADVWNYQPIAANFVWN